MSPRPRNRSSPTWRRERYDAWVAAGKPAGGWIKFQAANGGSTTTVEPAEAAATTAETASRITAQMPDGKLPGWSQEDIATVTAAVVILVLALSAMAAHGARMPELGARQDEAEAIAAPATRILLRHIPAPKGARGDIADGVALATALVAYASRIYMVLGDRAREAREVRSNGVYNPAAVPQASTPTMQWPSANQVDGMAA